jgi:hypothetical protein
MDHEMKEGEPLVSPPTKQTMERGSRGTGDEEGGTLDDDDSPDAWWKKPA